MVFIKTIGDDLPSLCSAETTEGRRRVLMVLLRFSSFNSLGMTGFDFVISESACFCSGWQRFPLPTCCTNNCNYCKSS